MNGLQFEDLPAQQTAKIRQQLFGQYKIEVEAHNKTWYPDTNKARTALARLKAKYKMKEYDALTKLQGQQQEQQQVQQLIRQPQEYTREKEAALRMQLRPEAESLVFPEQPQTKPFTFPQIASLANNIQATAERAEQEPWYKRGEKKTRKSLIDQYLATVNMLKVSDPRAFGPARTEQFNDVWNRVMSTDSQFANWFDKQGKPPVEMKMITAEGPISRAVKEKALGKTPLGQTLSKQKKTFPATRYTAGGFGGWDIGTTPEQKKDTGPIRVKNRAGQTGTIPAHQWPEADAAGYTRI